MPFENLTRYLQATGDHLGVEETRYGGGFTAIVTSSEATNFLFGMLSSDDNDATQAQEFLAEHGLFPAASGESVTAALERLDRKLGVLYSFEPQTPSAPQRFETVKRFALKAIHDCEDGAPQTWYDVQWHMIVEDLMRGRSPFFYADASSREGLRTRPHLKALVEFQYTGDFAGLKD